MKLTVKLKIWTFKLGLSSAYIAYMVLSVSLVHKCFNPMYPWTFICIKLTFHMLLLLLAKNDFVVIAGSKDFTAFLPLKRMLKFGLLVLGSDGPLDLYLYKLESLVPTDIS